MTTLDVGALTAAREAATEEVPVGAGTVRVRALTRGEALQIKGTNEVAKVEQLALSWAMVEPRMTERDVEAWQKVSPAGEIQEVFDVILRLSGMEKSAQKAAYARFRD